MQTSKRKPTSRILTLDQLIQAKACQEQVNLFKELFGSEVKVTVRKAQSVASKFDWNFAAAHLLSSSGYTEYDKVRAPALSEYKKVCAPAWAEYDKVCATTFAALYISEGV